MTRAETYDDLARVERLLDEYAKIEALDPAKLPAIRGQLWDLLVTSELVHDLGVETMPDPDDFAGMVAHIDGYLCALKDAQIRGGLHVLGRAPAGRDLVDTVLAICRQPQGTVPSLRATVAAELGIDPASGVTRQIDRLEASAGLGSRPWPRGWDPSAADDPDAALGRRDAGAEPAAHVRRDRQPARGPRGGHARRPSGAPTRAAPTSCRPVGTSTVDPQACPAGDATASPTGSWTPPGRDRHVSPAPWGWSCGGRPTCAPRATTWPRSCAAGRAPALGRRSGRAPGPGAGAAERARQAPGRRDRADLGVLSRRLPRRDRPARRRRDPGRRPRRAGGRQPGPRCGAGRRLRLRPGPAPTARASTRRSRAGPGAAGPTSRRSTWPGPATRTGAVWPAWSHPTRFVGGSPPSRWP